MRQKRVGRSRSGLHLHDARVAPRKISRGLSKHVPMAFGGVMLLAAFAFAGHYLGRNAEAHNAMAIADLKPTSIEAPKVIQGTKVSLLPEGETFETMNLKRARKQIVMHEGKGDMQLRESNKAVEPVEAPPKTLVARIPDDGPKIEPAAINLKDDDSKRAVKRLSLAPKPPRIEQTFKLDKAEKQKVVAQRRTRLAEENCLARAVYFEARSESELGQMAVAKVVLNRTKTEGFPKTICGVVYQGSQRRNSCQFSFACDGLPDDVKQPAAWAQAKRVAKKAIVGQHGMVKAMGSAVNYHADYVKPKWSKTMRRLVKIGRHIFYADG